MSYRSNTELAALQMDLVANIFQETLKERAQLAGAVADYSTLAGQGVVKVSIPKALAFAAADVDEDGSWNNPTKGSTLTAPELELNKHKAIHYFVGDRQRLQTTGGFGAELIRSMAEGVAAQIDNDIANELLGKTADLESKDDSATKGTLKLEHIRKARTAIRTKTGSMEGAFMAVPSGAIEQLLAMDGFISADKYGSREALINGEIGRLLGFTIVESNAGDLDKTTNKNDVGSVVAWRRGYVAFATQKAPLFEQERSAVRVGTQYTLSVLYGVKRLEDNAVFNITLNKS